ncbi:hypothetical protein ACCAA_270116 [Candidatus Accumulibacter aalborgensis]|uniref:Transposase IS801/IS1294 domain-containing protein n=1 Tax=Candidatus Accumulibacter aalborgensis TaxID=1860102 RepID=A0A1A8XL39_9PROT|nr:hypothetical protein ACCAA_270116 [Candidatus Accumulibacter aalborgensis]
MRVEGADRQGLERLLRTCARPVFALERWREIDVAHLVYESVKPGSGGGVSLLLTPLELIERLAALIPPPRRHRHRYYGILAPTHRYEHRSPRLPACRTVRCVQQRLIHLSSAPRPLRRSTRPAPVHGDRRSTGRRRSAPASRRRLRLGAVARADSCLWSSARPGR